MLACTHEHTRARAHTLTRICRQGSKALHGTADPTDDEIKLWALNKAKNVLNDLKDGIVMSMPVVTPDIKDALKRVIKKGKRGDKKQAKDKLQKLEDADESIRQALRDPIDRRELDTAIQGAEELHYKAEKLDVAKDKQMMLRVTELEEFTPKQKQHLETAINEAKKQQGAWGKKPVIITPKQLKAAEERLKELNNAEEAIRKAIQDPIDPKKLDNAIQEAEKDVANFKCSTKTFNA